MNNECGANKTADFKEHYCNYSRGHSGNHFDYGTRFTWPQGDCPAESRGFLCTLDKGHRGHHVAGGTQGDEHHRWPQEPEWTDPRYKSGVLGQFHETPEVVLKLTLEELKAVVYALSSPEWKEDEPELIAKIDAALKAAL